MMKALPTWKETSKTQAAILAKRFEATACMLIEDGCFQDLSNLLDVLPWLSWDRTTSAILGGAVRAMRIHADAEAEMLDGHRG